MTHSPRSCSEVEVLEYPALYGLFTRMVLPVRTRAERVQCLRGCTRHTKERGVEESSGAVEAGEASRRNWGWVASRRLPVTLHMSRTVGFECRLNITINTHTTPE